MGVLIVDQILDIELVVQDVFGDGLGRRGVRRRRRPRRRRWPAALLHLLVLTTPKPRAFFGWIMFLATLTRRAPAADVDRRARVGDLRPAWSTPLIGIAIWSLLLGVLSRTLRPGTLVD